MANQTFPAQYTQVPVNYTGPSWVQSEQMAPADKLSSPTTRVTSPVLMQWGPIQFEVWPLNIHAYEHNTETDWAHKEIAGAAIYREWVGENDETLTFHGQLFPYRIGGMSNIEAFEALRRAGVASMLMRGDGRYMGWFVCERLMRAHTSLSAEGVGQMIEFETTLVRCPVPSGLDAISNLWTVIPAAAATGQ